MTDDGKRCGAMDPKNRHACTQGLGHVGMHSSGTGFVWKDPRKSGASKAAASTPAPKPKSPAPKKAPRDTRDAATKLADAGYCGASFQGNAVMDKFVDLCTLAAGHDGLHENTSTGIREVKSTPTVDDKAVQAKRAEPTTSVGSYEAHPAAALFPMIEGEQYESFRDDIRVNGQRKKIVCIQVASSLLILDGRNRLRACLDLGVEPKFRSFGDEPSDGADPIAFVISENIARRHLDETDRSYIGAELVPMYEAQAKERQRASGGDRKSVTANLREPVASKGTAAQAAARAVNVSPRSIEHALKVNREAAPEVLAASKEHGRMAVSAAAELAKLPKAKQREIVAKEEGKKITIGRARALVKQEEKRDVVRKINNEQVAPAPVGPFRLIVADFPWPYDNSDQHEGSRGHIPYPSMPIEDGIAMAGELEKLAHEDGCILGFWTTNAFMPEAVRLVEAWGFSWRSIFTWDKGRDGIGTWGRGRTEHLIIAERGEVEAHTLNEVSTLIQAARREHSRKPDEVMAMFEKHCPGPRLEMFAREPRPNWAAWGAEVGKFETEAA